MRYASYTVLFLSCSISKVFPHLFTFAIEIDKLQIQYLNLSLFKHVLMTEEYHGLHVCVVR